MNLPQCRICRSTQFRRTGDGRFICRNNHIQNYYEEISESFQPGHGLLFRRKAPVAAAPTAKASAPERTEEEQRMNFLLIMQRLLVAQCDQLAKLFVQRLSDPLLVEEYKKLVKALWICYLDLYYAREGEPKQHLPRLTINTLLLLAVHGLQCFRVPFYCHEIVQKVSNLEIPFFDILTYVSLDSLRKLSTAHHHVFYHLSCPTAQSLNRHLHDIYPIFHKDSSTYYMMEDGEATFEYFYTRLTVALYGEPNGAEIYSSVKNVLRKVVSLLRIKDSNYFCSAYKCESCIKYAAVFVFVVKLFCRLADEQQNLCDRPLFDLLLSNTRSKFSQTFSKESFNRNWNILLVPLFPQDDLPSNEGILRDLGRIKTLLPGLTSLTQTWWSFDADANDFPKAKLKSYVLYDHSRIGEYHSQLKFLFETVATAIGCSAEVLIENFVFAEGRLLEIIDKCESHSATRSRPVNTTHQNHNAQTSHE